MSAVEKDILPEPQPEVPLNIYQRINEVRKAVGYIKKSREVDTGRGKYKAVTHDDVTGAIRNALIEQGVLLIPRLCESSVVDIGKTRNDTPIIRYQARYEIDFINCDDPQDSITIPAEAHANDSGDKAPGKALSYATKYAALKVLTLETGEDEESRVEPYSVKTITAKQLKDIEAKLGEFGDDKDSIRKQFLEYLKVDNLDELPERSFSGAVKDLDAKLTWYKSKENA